MTTVNPFTVAAWFISNCDPDKGEGITHLKLQKLLYYAEAWYLVHFDKPLFDEGFEAWAHGPVLRSVFDNYRDAGWKPLAPPEGEYEHPTESIKSLLSAVNSKYSRFSAKGLEEMTHSEAPWINARGSVSAGDRCTKIIDKLEVRNFYAARIQKTPIDKLRD